MDPRRVREAWRCWNGFRTQLAPETPFDEAYCHRAGIAVSEIIDYNPAPVPGPVVSRRSALEALSWSSADLDMSA